MKTTSIKKVNLQVNKLLNYVSDDNRDKRELTKEEIHLIHINSSALEIALEIAYNDNQLHKISFYNLNYWDMLFNILKRTNYNDYYYKLLKAGYANLLKSNGFKQADIEELLSRLP